MWQILKNCLLCSNVSSIMCISTIHVRLSTIPCWQDSQIKSGHTSMTFYGSVLTQSSQESASLLQLPVNWVTVQISAVTQRRTADSCHGWNYFWDRSTEVTGIGKKVLIKRLFMRKKVEQNFKRSPTKSLLIPTAQLIPLAQLFSMFVAKWSCFTLFFIVFSGLTMLFSTQKAYPALRQGTATNRAANMTVATATIAWMRRLIGWGRIRKNVCAGS